MPKDFEYAMTTVNMQWLAFVIVIKNAVSGAHYLDANILSESPQLSNDLARLFQSFCVQQI